MKRNIYLFAGAAVAFVLGAVLVSEVPAIGSLVVLFELAAGFGLGFLFKKFKAEEKETAYLDEITSLKSAIVKVKEEKSKIAKPIKTTKPKAKPENKEQ